MKFFRKAVSAVLASVFFILTVICSASAVQPKMGDANEDGKISSADARVILRICAKLSNVSDEILTVSDVNGDNRVSTTDARIVLCVAAHIYNESIFVDKLSKDETVVRTTKPPVSRDDPVDWSDIFGTSAPETERTPTTTKKPVHPNNNHSVKPTESTATVPHTTEAPTTEAPSVIEPSGTVPSSGESKPSVTATAPPPVIHTGVPSRPSTEATTVDPSESSSVPTPVTTTEPVVTTDPTLPAFRIERSAAPSGYISFDLYADRAVTVNDGILSVKFDPAAVSFVGFEENTIMGMIDCRSVDTGELACMFSFDHPASGQIYFGKVTFRAIDEDVQGSSLSLSVKGHYSYNWVDSAGRPIAVQPYDSNYYFLIDG